MGYRDEGEAALHRIGRLEDELAAARSHAEGLERALAAANAEIVRLRGMPVAPPRADARAAPAANVLIARAGLVLSALALLFTAAQGYSSETRGVQAAVVALPVVGATVAAFASRRRTVGACLALTAAGGLVTFVLVLGFFATLWRSF